MVKKGRRSKRGGLVWLLHGQQAAWYSGRTVWNLISRLRLKAASLCLQRELGYGGPYFNPSAPLSVIPRKECKSTPPAAMRRYSAIMRETRFFRPVREERREVDECNKFQPSSLVRFALPSWRVESVIWWNPELGGMGQTMGMLKNFQQFRVTLGVGGYFACIA